MADRRPRGLAGRVRLDDSGDGIRRRDEVTRRSTARETRFDAARPRPRRACGSGWRGLAWKLFQPAFRDKRELDDLLKCVIPVRNDLAHFRRVPAKELDRCRLAADDLLGATAKL